MQHDSIDCVQCGYCCTQGPCLYGKARGGTGPDNDRCMYLSDDMKCWIYEEIVEFEKDEGVLYSMFGCGCSSSMFNTVRDLKIAELAKKKGLIK